MRAIVVAALACTSLLACSEAPAPREPALAFEDCGSRLDLTLLTGERADRLTFACATLDVPLRHHDPDGDTLPMAVVRVRDAQQHDRIGSLVLNPGGPGNPGLKWIVGWAAAFPDEVLERFDLVTFDPRGTGLSDGINCADLPEDDEPSRHLDLTVDADYEYLVAYQRRRAESCADSLTEERISTFNTTATARDLDLLREALGDGALTYLGFSYGAKLGGAYAHLYPDRVRALALDAPADPRADPLEVAVQQVQGFEDSFTAYAADCPNRPSCERLGDPQAALASLVDRADGMPIPSGRPVGDPPMGAVDVLFGVAGLLFSDDFWPLLDEALAEALLGDSGTLHEAIDNTTGRNREDTGPDASEALAVINCNDAPPGPTRDEVVAAAGRLADRAPLFAPLGSWWLIGCAEWTAERTVLEAPEASSAPPLLVVGTRHDPATPYAGAVAFAETLGSGHLVTWEGQGHTAYGRSDCITDLVDTYLLELTVPAEGTRCPA